MSYLHRIHAVERTTPVFVYQTLKSIKLRQELLKEDVEYQPATVENYRNVDCGDGYHTLEVAPGKTASGEILHLTAEELKTLDEWEDLYERKKVTLLGGRQAWVYLMKAKDVKAHVS